MRHGLTAVAAVLFLWLPMHSAEARCVDSVGCTDRTFFAEADLERLSCQTLWLIRNSIFDEKGYCFRTSQAIAAFSNGDCSVRDANQLALNNFERANAKAIRRVEKRQCEKETTEQAPRRVETRPTSPAEQQVEPQPRPSASPPARRSDPHLPTGRGGTALPQ